MTGADNDGLVTEAVGIVAAERPFPFRIDGPALLGGQVLG